MYAVVDTFVDADADDSDADADDSVCLHLLQSTETWFLRWSLHCAVSYHFPSLLLLDDVLFAASVTSYPY